MLWKFHHLSTFCIFFKFLAKNFCNFDYIHSISSSHAVFKTFKMFASYIKPKILNYVKFNFSRLLIKWTKKDFPCSANFISTLQACYEARQSKCPQSCIWTWKKIWEIQAYLFYEVKSYSIFLFLYKRFKHRVSWQVLQTYITQLSLRKI